MKNIKLFQLAVLISILALGFTACEDETPDTKDDKAGFLASNIDKLGDIDLGGFAVPSSYDITGSFAPGAYNGQIRRLAQLKEIVDSSRNEPIFWDIANAMEVGGLADVFRSPAAQNTASSKSDLRSKIDELNFDNGNTSVADAFATLATNFVASSQANYTVTAANGKAGMITTGDKKRHVDAN
ncbi:MAG: hypothetical protein AAFO82_09950, partial [Bacteroidota bacterium]